MRRPWNMIDVPVYSLATTSEKRINMNIVTYVTAISQQPKCYAVSVEKGSQTHNNIERNDVVVLQLMHKDQFGLVRYLGKESGCKKDKQGYLEQRNMLVEWQEQKVLRNSSALLLLRKLKNIDFDADHVVYCLKLLKCKSIDEQNILTLQDLIERRIILS